MTAIKSLNNILIDQLVYLNVRHTPSIAHKDLLSFQVIGLT